MLVKYRNSQNKMALGLLSLMLKEREVQQLQQMMQRYEQNPDMEMYFWKEEEKHIGIIGIEVQEKEFIIKHVAVLPTFRGEGIGRAMVNEIQDIYSDLNMTATEETESFVQSLY